MKKAVSLKSVWKHPLGMALCCILPMVLVLGLLWSGIIGTWGYYLIFLLCPLMHLLMPHQNHGNRSHHGNEPENSSRKCH